MNETNIAHHPPSGCRNCNKDKAPSPKECTVYLFLEIHGEMPPYPPRMHVRHTA